MSLQISAATLTAKLENDRPLADFPPSVWGDLFLSHASNTVKIEDHIKHGELKEEVRRMVISATVNPFQHLDLIDAIQRLGVSYHFEKEIDEFMQKLLEMHGTVQVNNGDGDLHFTSLLFRLLRQHGYRISCENMFNKFKDTRGNFKESLVLDVKGLLSLYEATQLRVHGEDILDEAFNFTSTHLASMTCDSLIVQINHALRQSIRRSIPRLEARHFISVYQEDDSHNGDLLTFAKLDFNILQNLHQKELSEVQRWWKGLDVPTKLFFARDRVVECYFWALSIYFEPEYALGRNITAKVIAMISVVNDMFDAYGKLEEIKLFNEAIERWNINSVDDLPEYMKHGYRALLDIYEEMEKYTIMEGKSYRVPYAKEVTIGAYFQKVKWLNQNYIPNVEEFMENYGYGSSGYFLILTTSFVGMGDVAIKEIFELMSNYKPKIVKAMCLLGRLMNDIASDEFEQQRAHAVSALQCYTKQYGNGKQEAMEEFQKQIENAWKDINEECLYPTLAPTAILMRVLNIARSNDFMYKDCCDNYTFSGGELKDAIISLLIDSLSV